jgi:hypothetical protein
MQLGSHYLQMSLHLSALARNSSSRAHNNCNCRMLLISSHLGLEFYAVMSQKPKLTLLIHENCLNCGVP